ncbi:glycosyltransferase family 4 protein [Sphingomonas faeni]|uniref:glycosyltransferase family 4 protein n=1 Tax=Sphingomonas faeni TaxID=185950 RepID=UPI002786F74B|nr:glycosyltransferase family 4 protein [Sphingomonas faeni]MDQ0838833.1 glycosyltransferase involved in cell wall biosynthesis [Sphingomonas faeni]
MKLVVVHDFANAELGAGATRCALDTAIALRAQGVDVTFLAAAGEPDRELLDAGVNVKTLGQADLRRNPSRAKALLQGLWNEDAERAMRKLIAEVDLNDTIFHVHTWSKALSPSILPPLMSPGVHAIFHMHEYFAACPNGGFFDYPSLSICTRKPLGLDCLTTQCDSRSGIIKAWRVGRHAIMHARAHYPAKARNFILLSETQRRVLQPYLPAAANIVLVRNPIAVDKQPRVPRGPDARYLFVGRISKEKGLSVLAQGFVDRQHQLVVIGDGPDLDWLKASLPNADFRGWQAKNQVQEAMREARALVFPSLWYEGMPMVVLEALACGAPVISSSCSSAAEVVSHGKTGLVFDAREAASLSEATRVLDDDATAEAMSDSAYQDYWAAPCDMLRFANEMTVLYQNVMKQGSFGA